MYDVGLEREERKELRAKGEGLRAERLDNLEFRM